MFQADFAVEARTRSWLDKCSTLLIHHEGADAADIAKECALTVYSDGERHGDFDIRCINRYVWGSHFSAPHAVWNIVALDQPRTSKATNNLLHGSQRSNFCFLDAVEAVCNLKRESCRERLLFVWRVMTSHLSLFGKMSPQYSKVFLS